MKGDLDAFNQLVVTYQNLAYSVAYRTLQDDAAAADAVQDSFIKAYRAIENFQGGSFKSSIIRIVANTCYDQPAAANAVSPTVLTTWPRPRSMCRP